MADELEAAWSEGPASAEWWMVHRLRGAIFTQVRYGGIVPLSWLRQFEIEGVLESREHAACGRLSALAR
jgi:hypothetical protein